MRKFDTPLCYRVVEGLTSFCMPTGFILGGGNPISILFLIYVLHAVASCFFHIFRSDITLFLDISLINLQIMERAHTIFHNPWIYPAYMTMMFIAEKENYWVVSLRIVCVIFMYCIAREFSIYYLCMWVLSFLTFIQSHNYTLRGNAVKTTITTCLYHFYLGCVSFMEVPCYDLNVESHWIQRFLRYCFYFIFVFDVAFHLTEDKRILNCALSVVNCLVLTPLSFYETTRQCLSPNEIYKDTFQDDMILFYISFCVMDIIHGAFHYPEYLKWLDGILHHLITAIYASYFLWMDKSIFFAIGLIEEASTIFLNLSRLFPHLKIFKKLFRIFFVIFRIIIPTFLIFFMYPLSLDPVFLSMYISCTAVNFYWLSKQIQKK